MHTINFHQNLPIQPMLKPYVKSIAIELFSTNVAQNPLPYSVLPDFSVVMGFQYQGTLSILEQAKKRPLAHCGISGLQTQYKLFQPECSQTKTILVELYPWAINVFFKEEAHHFTNQALALSDIVGSPAIARLEEQFAATTGANELSRIIQTFLLARLTVNNRKLPSQHIIAIAQQLSRFDTVKSIADLAKIHGLSKRNLERQFKNLLGLSPKKFLRLGQFQRAIYHMRNGAGWEQIIEQLNYYDQAHFINSFKQFSGLTPNQFITPYTS